MSMRTWRSWLVAVCLVAAACSDDKSEVVPDAHVVPDGSTAPDGPVAATFAGEVIDLIVNKTADDSAPVAVDFASPDTEDPAVFDSLF
jgi:hypothetical protein